MSAPSLNTRVCTFTGCCGTGDEETAWSEAYKWWTCNGPPGFVSDIFCGVCCLPCAIGAIKSEGQTGCDIGAPRGWCPTSPVGWLWCSGATVCNHCIPIVSCCMGIAVADGYNDNVGGPQGCCPNAFPGNDFVSAAFWFGLWHCTCAPCIIASEAKRTASAGKGSGALL